MDRLASPPARRTRAPWLQPVARRRRQLRPDAAALLFLLLAAPQARAAGLHDHARTFRSQLVEQSLPWWLGHTVDRANGGYILAAGADEPASEKQLVTQSRMVWSFARAHRAGLSDAGHDYLAAAEHGYRFLMRAFLDPVHGGYYWTTALDGSLRDDRKVLYGQAFVMYALVEYHRAGGDAAALDRAMVLYRTIQEHAHDRAHGGWLEHFAVDWRPILDPASGAPVEVPGCKSANTHLHMMEALAELYAATRDAAVGESLAEALRLNATHFYPPAPGESCLHRRLDWQPVHDPASRIVSYGHNVEFAWLMLRAEEVLDRPRSWPHFRAHVDHALKYGEDEEHGGLFNRGLDDRPATDRDKVWWVQAEWLAALTVALGHEPRAEYEAALARLLEFLLAHQIDPADGIWLDTLAADGAVKSARKAHNWKGNYHDLRATLMFVERFDERTRRKQEWAAYMQGLRLENARHPRMLDVLNDLEGRRTRIVKR